MSQWEHRDRLALRSILIALYPGANDARRVLSDAGLPVAAVDLSGSAQTFWSVILEYAAKQDGDIDAIVGVAQSEYPRNRDLQALLTSRSTPGTAAAPTPPVSAQPPPPNPVVAPPVAPVAPATPAAPATTIVVATGKPPSLQKLSGPEWRELQEALLSAFPAPADLTEFVKFGLSQNLAAITSAGSLRTDVYNLIQWSQARGITARLFAAARAERPDNPDLLAFESRLEGASASPASASLDRGVLQRLVRARVPQFDMVAFLSRCATIQSRVCRVEVGGRAKGTGFLVGPSAVMTCYHVAEEALAAKDPSRITLRFDYRTGSGGTPVALASQDWCIDSAPYAPWERRALAAGTPEGEQLDYAVLRLARNFARDPVGAGGATPNATERGFETIPGGDCALMIDDPLFVVQHPTGDPVKIAIETRAVVGFNANRTRLQHAVNTEGGSSGAPVFDFQQQLVALHHAGSLTEPVAVNQAVPIDRIRALLEQRGKLADVLA